MPDVLPPPVAAPSEPPPRARAAIIAAVGLTASGAYVCYRGTQIPNPSILNIVGMVVTVGGFAIAAIGVAAVLGLLTRSPGSRAGIVATTGALCALTLLSLPLARPSPGGTAAALLVVGFAGTLLGLVVSPPLWQWLGEGEAAKRRRGKQRMEERLQRLAEAPRHVQVLVVVGFATLALFYIAGPPVPHGPVASQLHERVDLLRLHTDLALGPPVEHEEDPRRFQLFRASERRRWVVEGDVPGVTQLVRDYLTSLEITKDEAGRIEAARCGIGVMPRQKACHLSVTIDIRDVGDGLVEVELAAWASAHRY